MFLLTFGVLDTLLAPGMNQMARLYRIVAIPQVFRFEELGVELITPGLYRVFFRDMEIGEFSSEEMRFRAARRVL